MHVVRGLLVRVRGGARVARRTFEAAGVRFELEPLFADDPRPRPGRAARWYLAQPAGSLDGAHGWELAQAALRSAQDAAMPVAEIEPDLEQRWPLEGGLRSSTGLTHAPCRFDDQSRELPGVPGRFAWHLDADHSQLADARSLAGQFDSPVRIAHLDTGFDPDHATRPERLRLDLQRNFADDGPPDDARDPGGGGVLQSPGHGTATLALLAGSRCRVAGHGYAFDAPLGGAPDAEIVPVRIAGTVVQFRTSALARGIAFAAGLRRDDVHVLSLSMGGVASAAWAHAVNRAYEAGIVMVAAAGNNYSAGRLAVPSRFVVYPARFARVIAACGVMADGRPYRGLPAGSLQGSWGPPRAMRTAVAACTPNVARAEMGCRDLVDMNGSGTSAAAPQVAAAAALYLQAHAVALFDRGRYPEPWMRVEAVRHALFETADAAGAEADRRALGRGRLRAARMLALPPAGAAALRRTPPDAATLPFLRVLFGVRSAGPALAHMLALEATQLAHHPPHETEPNPFDEAMPDPDRPASAVRREDVARWLAALARHPDASSTLRAAVASVS